jgi:hypothetical protein
MQWRAGSTPDTGVIGHQCSFSAHGFDGNFRTFTGAMISTGGRPLLPSGAQAIRSASRVLWHGGAFVVMFPDIPEAAITQGDTLRKRALWQRTRCSRRLSFMSRTSGTSPLHRHRGKIWRDDSRPDPWTSIASSIASLT